MRKELSKQEMMKFFHTALLFTPVDYEAGIFREIKIIEYLIDRFCEDDELLSTHPICLTRNLWEPYHYGDDTVSIREISIAFNNIISYSDPIFESLYELEIKQMEKIFDRYKASLDHYYMRNYIVYHHEKPEFQKEQI